MGASVSRGPGGRPAEVEQEGHPFLPGRVFLRLGARRCWESQILSTSLCPPRNPALHTRFCGLRVGPGAAFCLDVFTAAALCPQASAVRAGGLGALPPWQQPAWVRSLASRSARCSKLSQSLQLCPWRLSGTWPRPGAAPPEQPQSGPHPFADLVRVRLFKDGPQACVRDAEGRCQSALTGWLVKPPCCCTLSPRFMSLHFSKIKNKCPE